jgi:putative SOS response-associated peptidase YedK
MRWGLVPYWAKDPSIALKTINATSETAAEKPAFRDALRRRRCLIPADGFYEWKRLGPKTKQAYQFGMADDSAFAFAVFGNDGKVRISKPSKPAPSSRLGRILWSPAFMIACR